MTTKTFDQQTARLIASVATCMPLLSGEVMQGWIDNPQALKKFLGGLNSPAETKLTPLFSVIATTNLGTFDEKKTVECFPRPRYVYRDSDLDAWLGATQPKTDACSITTLGLTKEWTFAEAAAKVLGIGAGTNVKLLGKLLIKNGHTITLTQAEEMVEATERGEKTGMRTDGYGNFFFVETGDKNNPVSVGRVDRVGRDWSAFVYSLGDGRRWRAAHRLLVRNLSGTRVL